MCIICVELIKQQMTLREAQRNLGEIVNDTRETEETREHYKDLKEAIDTFDLDRISKLLGEDTK